MESMRTRVLRERDAVSGQHGGPRLGVQIGAGVDLGLAAVRALLRLWPSHGAGL